MKQLLFALVGLAVATRLYAQVDTDPNKSYAITPEAGPWMICATYYVGPDASKLAHELVMEIRSRHHLPAFVFNRGDEERRKHEEERRRRLEELKRLQEQYGDVKLPVRAPRVEEQCAVLIGGYKDMDAASKALEKVKKLPPPSSERLMPWLTEVRPIENSSPDRTAEIKAAPMNPFVTSFVTRNPTEPHRPLENKQDPFLKELNAGEAYSLLRCSKPWTLLVATYQGMTVFQPKADRTGFFEKLWSKNSGELLAASGQNAHNLAEALHKLGFEAYVLHTRQGSVVTVGAYDRSDDPKMQQIQTALASNVQLGPRLQMLSQPVPMPVPRP
jgi:hypothetical protein